MALSLPAAALGTRSAEYNYVLRVQVELINGFLTLELTQAFELSGIHKR